MRAIAISFLLATLTALSAGCVNPTPPDDERRSESAVGDVAELDATLYAGPVVAHQGAWVVAGNLSLDSRSSRPEAWRIEADGKPTRLPDMQGSAYGRTWVFGRSLGDTVQLLGYTRESGMCCARYFGPNGQHADGYFESNEPIVGTWRPETGQVDIRALTDCEERGSFKAVEAGGDVYILGGQASSSTDQPARYDARDILRLRSDGMGCERTGATLPARNAWLTLEHDDDVLVALRDGYAEDPFTVWFSPDNGTVWPSSLRLPTQLDHQGASVVRSPEAWYVIGVTGPLVGAGNTSRIVRIDPARQTATILSDVIDRRAAYAAAFWADGHLVLAGGAQAYDGGYWPPSNRVSLLRPSDDPAGLQPPVARFTTSAALDPTNLTVQFDASTSLDPDGRVVAWHFEFLEMNGCLGPTRCYYWDGIQVTHEYLAPGDYTVRLTVTDDLGFTGVHEDRIHLAGQD